MAKEREEELVKQKEEEESKKPKEKKQLTVYRNGVGKYIEPGTTKRSGIIWHF